jgi:flavodoxin
MGADLEEVIDKRDRSGVKGYVLGGRDALKKYLTEIEPLKRDVAAYDLVVLGTPVWAGTMAPAIRTVIAENKEKFKKVAFFSTQGSEKLQKVFAAMEEASGLKPEAVLYLSTRAVKRGEVGDKLKEFAREI